MNLNGLILSIHAWLFTSITPIVRDSQSESKQEVLDKMIHITNLTRASFFLPLLAFLFGLAFLLIRMKKIRENAEKDKIKLSEMTPEELKAIYGDDLPEGFASIDKMSRDELRVVAEKELEKEGREVGEPEYLKGPLDWDDVDDNFQPRPKVIRSELSRSVDDESDNLESKKSDSEDAEK